LYGFPVGQVLAWVDESLGRLRRLTEDVVLTDLPMSSIRRLSRARFLLFRSILVPSCRLTLGEVLEAAEAVNDGLGELSKARGARLLHPDPAWYGIDPIHIRPRYWRSAWMEILGTSDLESTDTRSALEALRLHLLSPERRWLCGIEQRAPQTGLRLRRGGRVWLY
jgi:hypothetical protein